MDYQISTACSVLIVPLYIIGSIIKGSKIKDEYIPLILTIISIALASMALKEFSIESIIQGVYLAGGAVLGNNGIKQVGKLKEAAHTKKE